MSQPLAILTIPTVCVSYATTKDKTLKYILKYGLHYRQDHVLLLKVQDGFVTEDNLL